MMFAAKPSQDIENFAAQLITAAWLMRQTVQGLHNSTVLSAKPGDTRDMVLKEWNEAQRRSYFGGDR